MITITTMALEHLDAVYDIECHSFSNPWCKDDIANEIGERYSICLVALTPHGEVAGFATMRHIINEGHICNIATHEDHRKKGVASALVEELIQAAYKREMIGLTLEVRIGNRAAMALYHKFGFRIEGYRKGYYSYPTEDAAIMWKYINI